MTAYSSDRSKCIEDKKLQPQQAHEDQHAHVEREYTFEDDGDLDSPNFQISMIDPE